MFDPILAETFWDLMRDPAHWQYEIFVNVLENLVVGFLIGMVIWPAIRRHIHRDVRAAEEHEHSLIAELQHRLALLEGDEEAILKEVHDGKMTLNRARELLGYPRIDSTRDREVQAFFDSPWPQ